MSGPSSLELEDTGKGERDIVIPFTTILLKNYKQEESCSAQGLTLVFDTVFLVLHKEIFLQAIPVQCILTR